MYWMVLGLTVILVTVLILRSWQDRRFRERAKLALERDEHFVERSYQELLARSGKVNAEDFAVELMNSMEMLRRLTDEGGFLAYIRANGNVRILLRPAPIELNGTAIVQTENGIRKLYIPKNAAALSNFYRNMIWKIEEEY